MIQLVKIKKIASHEIEEAVKNPERGVGIRRQLVSSKGDFRQAMKNLPYKNYDYSKVSEKVVAVEFRNLRICIFFVLSM